MILYFYSIVLGIVQGLTEFLPISSSGHLILIHRFLEINLFEVSAIASAKVDNLSFDVALHLGTLLALIIFFKYDLVKYLKVFFQSFKNLNVLDADQKIIWFILIATIPSAVSGFLFEDIIKTFFSSLISIAISLIIGSILFIVFEKFSSRQDFLEKLNFKSALIIGFAQAVALIPGVSRSGITIVAGLGRKLNRESAARFSFLLSIPIIFGAGLKKFLEISLLKLSFDQGLIFILGFLSAFISGYFCVKYFLRYLKNHSLIPFAIYRFLLAVVIILFLIFV